MIKGHPEIPVIDVVAWALIGLIDQHCIRSGQDTLGHRVFDGRQKNTNQFIVTSKVIKDGREITLVAYEFNLSDRNNVVNRRALAALESIGLVERDARYDDRFFGRFTTAGDALLNTIDGYSVHFEEVDLAEIRAGSTQDNRLDQFILALLDLVLFYCGDVYLGNTEPEFRCWSTISCEECAIEILVILGILDELENQKHYGLVGQNVRIFEEAINAPPRELRVPTPVVHRFGNLVEDGKTMAAYRSSSFIEILFYDNPEIQKHLNEPELSLPFRNNPKETVIWIGTATPVF